MSRWTLLLTLVAVAGCQPFSQDLWENPPWSSNAPGEFKEPHHMIVIWKDAVVNLPGRPPTRGIGGRVYFYSKASQPIPVDGELIVYAYDDTNGAENHKPSRRFVFTADQFTEHYSETDIGASYSIWLPWDQFGNPETEISLIPVFTATTTKKVVKGDTSLAVLPGKKKLSDLERRGFFVGKGPQGRLVNEQPKGNTARAPAPAPQAGNPIQQIGYQEGPPVDDNRRVTTIRVNRSLRQRLREASNRQPALQRTSPPPMNAGALNQQPAPPQGIIQEVRTNRAPNPQGESRRPTRFERRTLSSAGFTGIQPHPTVREQATNPPTGSAPPQAHYGQPRFQAPASPVAPPGFGHGPSQPYPAGPQFGPASAR